MKVPLGVCAALVLAPLAAAQQSRSLYDAAQIVLGPVDAAFEELLDYDGDGTLDALGFWADVQQSESRSRCTATTARARSRPRGACASSSPA